MSVTLVKARNELLDQLEALEQWWPDSNQIGVSGLNAREVMTRLIDLRSSLRQHFQSEESQGALSTEATANASSVRNVEQLLREHDELLERLNVVIASVPLIGESGRAWVGAKCHFKDFRKQLEAHERAEIDLLQATTTDNPGVGD